MDIEKKDISELECDHIDAHYESWPDGGAIEVCEDCGMSRHHWEWGESDWIMVPNIPRVRENMQKSIDRIIKNVKRK